MIHIVDYHVQNMNKKLNILCVGLCCLDIISEVPQFPVEDSDQRCLDQRWQRGGNAANNCTVLGLLGAKPSFCGTVADSHEKRFLLDDFAKFGVNTDHVVLHNGCESPASCIIMSMATGSRTIVHANKNLPELSLEDFIKIDLSSFTWVHFEGRNVNDVCKMIQHIRDYNKKHTDSAPLTISVEIEKAKPELEALIPLPDIVFVSKDYAQFKGYTNMAETIEKIRAQTPSGTLVICPWGEEGASASNRDDQIVYSPAYPPACVVDTLGAGDTFNAATIYALSRGLSPKDSITFGCRIAGSKVGIKGWEPLRDIIHSSNFLPVTEEALGQGETFSS